MTEQQEEYAQLRARGYTKTEAAKMAYPNSEYAKQIGYKTERLEHVAERIQELKDEYLESSPLDFTEQVRRYNEIYRLAMKNGKHSIAMQALEKLDKLGGFDAPSKSLHIGAGAGHLDALKVAGVDVGSDNLSLEIDRFSKVLNKHHTNTANSSTDEVKDLVVLDDALDDGGRLE